MQVLRTRPMTINGHDPAKPGPSLSFDFKVKQFCPSSSSFHRLIFTYLKMKSSPAYRMPSMEGVQGSGRTPLRAYGPQPTYETYKSPYGPKTKNVPNLMGLSTTKAYRYGSILAGFGVSAGIFALYFFGEVPKVRKDILSKVPLIGDYFVRETPPEDNPF